ncbi:MAG: TlpA disulfide reductase family protein [Pseudomonadota bacterium]
MTDTEPPRDPQRMPTEEELEKARYAYDRSRKRFGGIVIAGIAAVALIGTYFFSSGADNEALAACPASTERLAEVEPRTIGEVAALLVPKAPEHLSDLAFEGADGQPMTMADFAGRTVLLNLWATWCAPCREEMPALDRLEATLGSDKFEVVAVNIDTGGGVKARAFLDEIGVEELGFYADHSMKIFQDLRARGRAFGMPTTVLIDSDGCELGTMSGPAHWDSEDAMLLIRTAVGMS